MLSKYVRYGRDAFELMSAHSYNSADFFLWMGNAKQFHAAVGAGFIGSAFVRQVIRETEHTICVADKLAHLATMGPLLPFWQPLGSHLLIGASEDRTKLCGMDS